nr:ribonuclease H-like domain-containing protein [Tanacetum cinerariifolium]
MIQQYLQNENYALWEVIEFGDSYEAPQEVADTSSASEGSAKKKGRTVAVTTEDIQKRRNDVKARTILLLALPDEHQLRFSKYKTAQELWAAILKTFGGNEATKKTKKNQLKQQYGNFKAEGKETLEQTFNRPHAIVNHLEFMDVEIKQDDMNRKFLTSLAPEWLMYMIVWRNRSDLDTMSLDDLYNHLKVYEPEVKKKSELNSQNMAFISSAKTSSGKEEVNTASFSTANTQVSPSSVDVATASFIHDTVCAYIASQSNGSQVKYEYINQIDEDDIDEIDIKAPRSQDRGRRENFKQGSKTEEQTPKALMAIDRVGWDWSYMANEEEDHALVADEEAPTEFALMAKSSSDTKVFDNSLCSKACKKNTDSLNTKITELSKKLSDIKTTLYHYKLGLSQVEARLVEFKNQENKICKKIRGLEFKVESKDNRIERLTNELEELKKEKTGLDSKLTVIWPMTVPYGRNKGKHGHRITILIRDSGCSRHMTGNISYLSDYEPYDGGYVSFGQGCGKITGKGIIKTGKLKFENVYFVKDLKYNLFSVSQIYYNKNSVLFTNSECIVLGRDFKLRDDTNVLLRTPRKHNMYSIDLNNIVPLKDLTCLVTKASSDKSVLWHRRLDNLGKFNAKGDEVYFIGYSISSKAFRVFNKRTKRVEENLHVDFLEIKLIEKGAGLNWLFDIDTLTNSMNYVPVVVAGTTSTNFSGTKDAASLDVKKYVSSLRYIALPNWFHETHLESSTSNAQDACNADAPESSGNSNPTATLTDPMADHMETLTVESLIPTVSSSVPTACLDDSPEPSSDTRLISKRVTSQDDTPSLDNILTLSNRFEDIFGVTINTCDTNRVEANLGNMENNISASPTPTFKIHKVHPKRVRPIGTKWVLENKKDERGIVIKNKARLMAQGHTQEEGIAYEEVFKPIVRIKGIRLFLAYASFMGFTVYQMDVKSVFLYGAIDEEVYVMQPLGF